MLRLFLAVLILASTACRPRVRDPLPGFPRIVLWAWERPEHLSFIIPQKTGVAYLAGTISLRESRIVVRPRLQPLFIPDRTPLIAVVRIETSGPPLTPVDEVTRQIVHLTDRVPVRALQIDFDAGQLELGYYGQLLREIHRRMPSQPLEITALVSWCESNRWLKNLPVVDAVPMFFRMGMDRRPTTIPLRATACLSSLGISTDEYYAKIPRGRRIFIFNPLLWTETTYRAILRASKAWLQN